MVSWAALLFTWGSQLCEGRRPAACWGNEIGVQDVVVRSGSAAWVAACTLDAGVLILQVQPLHRKYAVSEPCDVRQLQAELATMARSWRSICSTVAVDHSLAAQPPLAHPCKFLTQRFSRRCYGFA